MASEIQNLLKLTKYSNQMKGGLIPFKTCFQILIFRELVFKRSKHFALNILQLYTNILFYKKMVISKMYILVQHCLFSFYFSLSLFTKLLEIVSGKKKVRNKACLNSFIKLILRIWSLCRYPNHLYSERYSIL